ncbi:MAG: SDR family NAD(P)-dependent oxidoreductase, partial [Verrucomicrobiota bacterium]
MDSLWSDADASAFEGDLGKRVYTSRLLGANPSLVLHGGGNTSVKVTEPDFYGDETEVLYVKGSGWDLATIEAEGFSPVRMKPLLAMSTMAELSDAEMVKQQRAALLNPAAPNPSIEAILHAILPFRFVDHTHANAILALTNHPEGEERVKEVFGSRVLMIPYVMPGFILSKVVAEQMGGRDLRGEGIEGMILLNHGIFTFDDDARVAYERMIELVSLAEDFLQSKASGDHISTGESHLDLAAWSRLRKQVGTMRGGAVIGRMNCSAAAAGFAQRSDIEDLAARGPVTPDHSIRTKRVPAVIGDDIPGDLANYASAYEEYFQRNQGGETMLDPSPRVAVWKGSGVASFGRSLKEADILQDLAKATWETVQWAEATGGWKALGEKEIFEVEYWELEQAKLAKGGAAPDHQGKVAIVSGSAAGIGFACAEALAKAGAQVIGLDLNPEIASIMAEVGAEGRVVNLTQDERVIEVIEETVTNYGGLDILVSNAGIFTAGAYLHEMEQENWDKSMAVNLTSHQKLLKYTIPFLKEGFDPSIVLVGSRNVN